MKAVFSFYLDMLDGWDSHELGSEGGSRMSAVELALAVLSKLMDCNTNSMLIDGLVSVVDRLASFVEDTSDDDYFRRQSLNYLGYVRQRLGLGEALMERPAEQHRPVQRTEFVLRRDLPGQLSAEGPRHDNDHADIADIKIMPTRDEIASVRSEYLPTTDPAQFHRPGIRGRLDREFRLLREDTVGVLRDAIRIQLEALKSPQHAQAKRSKDGLRTFTYRNAQVNHIALDQQKLDFVIQFDQPVPNMSRERRQEWWSHSRRLQPGALVAVISTSGSVLFFTVAQSTLHSPNKPQPSETTLAKSSLSLSADANHAYVHLNLVEMGRGGFYQALGWYRNNRRHDVRCLVEFPGVLLPSFQHTLAALQEMSKNPRLPFASLIAPDSKEPEENNLQSVPPPHYATKPGFFFDLRCLTKSRSPLRSSIRNPLDAAQLAEDSKLDLTQARALLDALHRGLALIQGPPGTGKSFTGENIIRVLLSNKGKAELGPILCVCYTNHALDQLLEHLDDGKTQIIRIGSRSKSEKLEQCNLRVVARNADRTFSERSALRKERDVQDELAMDLDDLLRRLETSNRWQALKMHLRESHWKYHDELFGQVDEDDFQTVVRQPERVVERWLQGGQKGDSAEQRTGTQLGSSNIRQEITGRLSDLTHNQRRTLYQEWLREMHDSIITDIVDSYKDYQSSKNRCDKVHCEVDLRCLDEADIVGVTTTGLAKNLALFQKLRCKVIICEEAGEVLEAHTLTALLPSVEHAILIGDHLQLRPQIQNDGLKSTNSYGVQYSLDLSLFERLVRPLHSTDPVLPFSSLDTQRRMHPDIAELVRSTLYPNLEDGGDVASYPGVTGMRERLFWFHHEHLEDGAASSDPHSTSHSNEFEIQMTIALVQHLVRQGSYGPDDIAVITPYLGQLFRLRRKMQGLFEISVGERDLEDLANIGFDTAPTTAEAARKTPVYKTSLLKSVRVATVDNFQGEEAKVVIISLVRSNTLNKCGFLSTSNRINVLLSRAKHGMYILGNSATYESVPMWVKVLDILRGSGKFGTKLELQCPRHPDMPVAVSEPDHFLQFSPEGGCLRHCEKRLDCGHACISRCHSDVLHSAVKCLEPCPRQKQGCNHPCRRVCGEQCEPKCTEKLTDLWLILKCSHVVTSAVCWRAQDPSSITCTKVVDRVVPGCKHQVREPCHVDVGAGAFRCPAMCGSALPCGHSCKRNCSECKKWKDGKVDKEDHGTCAQLCGRKYSTCRHACSASCHPDKPCPPCSADCEVRCSHSKCPKKCHEPCVPCAEQSCSSYCEHTRCTMPCAAPCDWVPCSRRCAKIMTCGHQCPSVCGEACPGPVFCQTCGTEDIKGSVVDFVEGLEFREVNLDEDPCLFPDCGHFVTMSNMDGIMDMTSHYTMSDSEPRHPLAIAKASSPFSMDEVKVCPTCRGSLRNIGRYGRIVRRAMLDEATKKFITWSNAEFLKLVTLLVDEQHKLDQTHPGKSAQPQEAAKGLPKQIITTSARLKQIWIVRNWDGSRRYASLIQLWHQISGHLAKVRKEEQPFQRVADFVQHAARQRGDSGSGFSFDEASIIQAKGQLQAMALLLKCEAALFTDAMKQDQARKDRALGRVNAGIPALDFSLHVKNCEQLIAAARQRMYPQLQIEGHVCFARFSALVCHNLAAATSHTSEPSDQGRASTSCPAPQEIERLRKHALEHLQSAWKIVETNPSTEILKAEIDAAERMVNDGVFYTAVSANELKDVYNAMAAEFRGTGHWYTCANGHPFTIGDCGLPRQLARCPECTAPIGGEQYQTAEGVRRADEIERLAGRLGGLRMGDV